MSVILDWLAEGSFFHPRPDGKTRAKICGVTSSEQTAAIHELGADAIGFNFWPKSKRFLTTENRDWLCEFSGTVQRVGVFVNEDEDAILKLVEDDLIDIVQLHGDEEEEMVYRFLKRGIPALKAIGVKTRESLEAGFPGVWGLLDAYAPTEYGGTGETMDWALGAEAVKLWPKRKIILAGGLHPGNVADAVKQVRPFAVDVASGVESEPGVKDLKLVEQFITATREA